MVAITGAILNTMFSPFAVYGEIYEIAAVSVFVAFLFAYIQKLMIDPIKLKTLKEEMKILQKKQKDAKKKNDPKELKKSFDEMLKLQHKQMMMTMKPMIVSMVPVLLIFAWLPSVYSGTPFILPFWLPFAGREVTWLGLYIIVSIPSATFFRKIFGMD